MTTSNLHSVALTCDPRTPTDVVRGIGVSLCRQPAGVLLVRFSLHAEVGRLRVPAPRPSRRCDLLWQHTCFEVFVRGNSGSAYQELNFAPSGEWAIYAFHGYREPAALPDDAAAPEVTVRCSPNRIELDAVVRAASLSTEYAHTALRVALAAVVEDARGALSYWALSHPPGKPDFHHPDAFALELAPFAGEDSIGDPR